MQVDSRANGEVETAPVAVAGPVRAIERRERFAELLPLPPGALAVAAGGVVAGATAIVTVRAVRWGRRLRRGRRRRKEIRRSVLATRSFLVDVHLLGR